MKRILFIGHEASRTGAPIVLLHFLQWLRENDSPFEADLLLLQPGGDLEDEYRKAVNTYVLPKAGKPHFFRRGANFLRKKLKLAPKISDLPPFTRRYDAVVGNTVISLEYLKLFKRKGFRTISWLHELDYAVNLFSREKFVELATYVDRFLVVSKAVEDMLKRFGIEKKTHQIYESAKIDAPVPVAAEDVEAVKNELRIPPRAFVVGASGTIEWRKGADIFLQAALHLAARRDDIYFLWVGGKSPYSNAEYDRIQYDFERLELKEKVIFTGMQKNPHRFYAAMDLFVLASREDPFPLVCLEAASLGKPTICFEKAGGMPEFVGRDAGAVVPYGDVAALCEKIIYFYENRDALRRAGEAARAKVNSEFSAEKSCSEIKKVLLEALGEPMDNR